MPSSLLLRSLALGAASGARSFTGVAAVAWTCRPDDPGPLPRRLGSTPGRIITALLAAGELVADQLPQTVSRLAPPALGARLGFGALSAAALAQRRRHGVVAPALVAAAAAGAAAVLGVRWREAAAARFGSDRPGALMEDVAAAGLARMAARRPSPGLSCE